MILSQWTVNSSYLWRNHGSWSSQMLGKMCTSVMVLFISSFSVTAWLKMFLEHLCASWDQQTGFTCVHIHDILFFFLHTLVFLLWISAWYEFFPHVVCLNKACLVKKGTGSASCLLGLYTPQLQYKLCNHLLILNVLSLTVRCAWRWMCVLEGLDATSGGAGRSAPSAGADTMIEEEEMT